MLHSRIERIQALLQSEIAKIIDQELVDADLPEFITVFGVKLSKDLSHALVFVTMLHDSNPLEIKRVIDLLNESSGFIGKLVARRVTLKRHPHLKFVYTDSTRSALEIEPLFQKIKNEHLTSGNTEIPEGDEH